jgi:uncharacterized membrane protein YphA (DoxX/SURF4 family)
MEHYRSSFSRKKQKTASDYLLNFIRIAMGLLFIFSGYVKLVDPMGTAIKFEEYFVSFGWDFFSPAAMVFSFLLNTSEFIIGFALLLGIQMQFTAWCLLLYMSFFTLLTCWLAYALDLVALVNRLFETNYQIFVVTDCGCFGDFLKLTNKETFYKNVVFIAFASVIFWQRKKYKQQPWYYITQWGPIMLVTGFALFAQIYGLRHEPWHDFRPWKVGNFIAGETYSQAPEVDFVFKYKNINDQSVKEITMDEMTAISADSLLADDLEKNYTYLDRVEKVIVQGINARLSDFTITDPETKEDIKNQIIASPNYTFLIFARDVTAMSEEEYTALSNLVKACNEQNMDFVIVTASLKEEVDTFNIYRATDLHFHYSDITPLKTAVRNNLGVVLLKDGYVMDKWSYRDIPALEEIITKLPKYDAKLLKYKRKTPPRLPNGKMLQEEPIVEEADTTTVN